MCVVVVALPLLLLCVVVAALPLIHVQLSHPSPPPPRRYAELKYQPRINAFFFHKTKATARKRDVVFTVSGQAGEDSAYYLVVAGFDRRACIESNVCCTLRIASKPILP